MSIQDTNTTHELTGKTRALFMFACLMFMFTLLSASVALGQEVSSSMSVFSKEIDGKLYIYAPASYSVRTMPTYSHWREWRKERPTSLQSYDGRSIATCVCCAIMMDVTNDLQWRMVSQKQIAVGCKVKLPKEEITGTDEITVTLRPQLVMHKGVACDSCWKEFIRIQDEVNTENTRRKELNAGRLRLKQLLDDLYDREQAEQAPPQVDVPATLCHKHPSMMGYCACLTASRQRVVAQPVRQRPVNAAEETEQLPMLTAYIDVSAEVRRVELPERDPTKGRTRQEQHNHWVEWMATRSGNNIETRA